jgi:hypothetical protein
MLPRQEGNIVKPVLRLFLVLTIVPSVYFFVYWLPGSLFTPPGYHWVASLVAMLVAIGSGWFVWRSSADITSSSGLGRAVVLGAVITGAIGFALGFFGPVVFMPDANQGPLIGIFITGPAGFVLGGFGGLAYWLLQNRKRTLD